MLGSYGTGIATGGVNPTFGLTRLGKDILSAYGKYNVGKAAKKDQVLSATYIQAVRPADGVQPAGSVENVDFKK